MPVRGPHVDRYPTASEPSTVPITIASSPSQNPRPSTIATDPVNATVMFTCGANHTVNSRRGRAVPLVFGDGRDAVRLDGHVARARSGRWPRKADSVSAREAMDQFDHDGRSSDRSGEGT